MYRLKQVRAIGLVVLLVTSVTAGVGLLAVGQASAQPPTPVSTCTTITEPGAYVLTGNVTDSAETTCIDILADDVVFDGGGYTLGGTYTGEQTAGVLIENATNVTVSNLRVTDWYAGIDLRSSTDATIYDVEAVRNTIGIRFVGSDGNVVSNVTADTNHYYAVQLTNSDANTLSNVTVHYGYYGIYADGGNDGTVLTDVTLDATHYAAVYVANSNDTTMSSITASNPDYGSGILVDGASGVSIDHSNLSQNAYFAGVRVTSSDHVSLRDVVASNTRGGLAVENSRSVTLSNVTANHGGGGISLTSVRNGTLTDSRANDNEYTGVYLDQGSSNVSVSNTTASGNAGGFQDYAGDGNRFTNDVASNNVYGGVAIYYSRNSTYSNLVLTNNSFGVYVSDARSNTLSGNTITENGAGIRLAGDNVNNLVYDNRFNNTENVVFEFWATNSTNRWNVSKRAGPNVVGGPYLGGNYYATPDGTGYSQTCTATVDGFCDTPYVVGPTANNTDYLPLAIGTAEARPDIAVSPTSVDFGTVTIGNATTRNVTVTNDGSEPLHVTDAVLGGANASDFAIVDGDAPFVLAPGASRNVTLQFAPGSAGTKTAILNVKSNDSDTPTVAVSLTGTATGTVRPDVLVKPSDLLFGRVFVGKDRTLQTIVINKGKATLHVTDIAITGPNATDFTVQSGAPFTLEPGASVRLKVTFAPAETGTRAATLTVASNDPDQSTIEVGLSGDGAEPRGNPGK